MNADLDDLGVSGLNIVHLNVARILNGSKFKMLRLQVEGSNIGVFCASETWLTADLPDDLIKIKGYVSTRVDRSWADAGSAKLHKKGGGLICYAKHTINCNEFKYAFLNTSCKDLAMQWMSLENSNLRRIILINVYRPPQGNYRTACTLISDAIKAADLKFSC